MRYVLSLFVLLGLAAPASAQFVGPGAQEPVTDVQAVLDNPADEQRVVLHGRILKQVGEEQYVFTDGTAQIRIELDGEALLRQRITPETEVELYGEIEDDFLQDPEIDVERVVVPAAESGQ